MKTVYSPSVIVLYVTSFWSISFQFFCITRYFESVELQSNHGDGVSKVFVDRIILCGAVSDDKTSIRRDGGDNIRQYAAHRYHRRHRVADGAHTHVQTVAGSEWVICMQTLATSCHAGGQLKREIIINNNSFRKYLCK